AFGEKSDVCSENNHTTKLNLLAPSVVPGLESKTKGDAGKIGIIGGSIEYTGAPYFAAISALKVGADLVYVVTTEEAAPVIKNYSPDLIVYPFLNYKSASKISSLLQKMDVIVIGPGLGREDETMTLVYDIIKTCKSLQKPLVIDADGLYALSKNPSIIKDYPSPGLILTPNQREANKLMNSVPNNSSSKWYNFWGDFVSVLVKGEQDIFFSSITSYDWSLSQGGSGRRAAGQGDILAGSLGTIFNWALKQPICGKDNAIQLSQSISAFAAAKLTRLCNSKGFSIHGRSMIASDMIGQIHSSFEDVF
ncbi:ATP-dependent (S)-NAD(P)H-hydrate dehydratase, partial [Operophtera brumata]